MNNRRRPEYRIWANIVQRTCNPNNPNWVRYGGAGKGLCDEWRKSFQRFFDHLGPRPSPKHSVDRIDFTRGYEPGNVRWATASEQARNKPNTIWLTVRGETRCLQDWADHLGVSVVTLYNRLERGWSHERTLGTPCKGRGHTNARLSHAQAEKIRELRAAGAQGKELAEMFGVSTNIVCRIHKGKTYKRAIESERQKAAAASNQPGDVA